MQVTRSKYETCRGRGRGAHIVPASPRKPWPASGVDVLHLPCLPRRLAAAAHVAVPHILGQREMVHLLHSEAHQAEGVHHWVLPRRRLCSRGRGVCVVVRGPELRWQGQRRQRLRVCARRSSSRAWPPPVMQGARGGAGPRCAAQPGRPGHPPGLNTLLSSPRGSPGCGHRNCCRPGSDMFFQATSRPWSRGGRRQGMKRVTARHSEVSCRPGDNDPKDKVRVQPGTMAPARRAACAWGRSAKADSVSDRLAACRPAHLLQGRVLCGSIHHGELAQEAELLPRLRQVPRHLGPGAVRNLLNLAAPAGGG